VVGRVVAELGPLERSRSTPRTSSTRSGRSVTPIRAPISRQYRHAGVELVRGQRPPAVAVDPPPRLDDEGGQHVGQVDGADGVGGVHPVDAPDGLTSAGGVVAVLLDLGEQQLGVVEALAASRR
jgi:hypothetical protein